MGIISYLKRGCQYVYRGVPQINVTANVVSLAPNDFLKGRTAIVTGGTSGIGRAITTAFLRAGADVVITGRELERTEIIARQIEKEVGRGRVFAVEMNNADVKSFSPKLDKILKMVGNRTISILVNNAGIGGGVGTHFIDCIDEEYSKVLDTNLKGAFFLSSLFAKYMIENKIPGNILNIASSSSMRPATTAYTLSKWGLKGMTIGLAKKLIKENIVVNGLAPGPTATPMLMKGDAKNIYNAKNPSQRYALPEEIANMAVVLVSDMGRMIVGDIVYMTGGAATVTVDDIGY